MFQMKDILSHIMLGTKSIPYCPLMLPVTLRQTAFSCRRQSPFRVSISVVGHFCAHLWSLGCYFFIMFYSKSTPYWLVLHGQAIPVALNNCYIGVLVTAQVTSRNCCFCAYLRIKYMWFTLKNMHHVLQFMLNLMLKCTRVFLSQKFTQCEIFKRTIVCEG